MMREDWIEVELGEVAELNPKLTNKEKIDGELEVQFLPMKLVEEVSNKIHLEEIRKFNEVQKKSYTYFEENDVLFAKVTPCMENGKIAIAKNLKNGIGYGSSEFHIFRCSEIVLNSFLFYYLVQEAFRREAQYNMTGAVGLRRVPKKYLEKYKIPLAPLPIQRAIVLKIESLFSSLDKGIADLKTAQEQLKLYRQAVLKKAFEGGFTHKNVKEGELPEGWKWVKLGEVFHTTSGGTPSRRNDAYYKGSIPWVKSGELDKGVIVDTEEKITENAIKNSSAKVFPKGTLLIALYGATIGKLAFLGVDAATNQAICGIFQNDNYYSKFLYNFLLFRKAELILQGAGGAQPNISQTILRKLQIPFPPTLDEQHAIVREIESRLSVCDKVEQSIVEGLEKAEALRQSILKKAFEGKLLSEEEIAKCKQEADYEPASELLKKIKAKKE